MSSPASQNEALLASGQKLPLPSQARTPRFSWFTTTRLLITANVLVFVAMLVYDYHVVGRDKFMNTRIAAHFENWLLLKWGSDYGVLTLGGQYWRVITSTFIHGNIVHLCGNIFFLWGLGRYTERVLGRKKALAVYLLTGALSSLVAVNWHPGVISYGASGAVYGLAGVLVAFWGFGKIDLPLRRMIGVWSWALLITPFSLLPGYASKTTDYQGHLGGLLSGFVIGVFLAWTVRTPQEQRMFRQLRVLLFASFALVLIFAGSALWHRNLIKLYHQELALQNKDLIAFMVVHSQRLVVEDPNDAQAHANLSVAYSLQLKNDEALAECRRALELDPENYSRKRTLASLYVTTMHFEEAVALYREILPHLDAKSQDYVDFAIALMLTNHLDEAEAAARKAVALDHNSANGHGTLGSILMLRGGKAEAERERKLAEQLRQAK